MVLGVRGEKGQSVRHGVGRRVESCRREDEEVAQHFVLGQVLRRFVRVVGVGEPHEHAHQVTPGFGGALLHLPFVLEHFLGEWWEFRLRVSKVLPGRGEYGQREQPGGKDGADDVLHHDLGGFHVREVSASGLSSDLVFPGPSYTEPGRAENVDGERLPNEKKLVR